MYRFIEALKFIFGIILSFTMLFGGLLYLGNYLATVSCRAQWENSGFKSDYGFFSGCLIQLEDGTWIPAENYREIP